MNDAPKDKKTIEVSADLDLKSPVLAALDRLRWWTFGVVCAVVILGIVTFTVRSIDLANVEESATQNRTALCALRADLRDRVQNSKQFLRQNPGGIPGVPPSQIREGIVNQQRTIDTLKVIDCSEVNGEE